MSANQELLESQRLFDYIRLGAHAVNTVANSLVDLKLNGFLSDDDLGDEADALRQQMTALIELEKGLNDNINASVLTQQQIGATVNEHLYQNDKPLPDAPNVNDLFDQNLAQISGEKRADIENDSNYVRLNTILKEIADDCQTHESSGDDELEALETDSNEIPIDPFSKLPIDIPVRNRKCGHLYDRQQLQSVIHSKQGLSTLRCPFIGCNQKVTMVDVEVDRKIKAKIENIRRKMN